MNIRLLFYNCSFFRSSLIFSFLRTVDFTLAPLIIIVWQYCSSSAFAALKINALLFSEYCISCLWVHYAIKQAHAEKLPKLLFFQWKYSWFCFKGTSFHLQMDLLLHLFLNSLSFIWNSKIKLIQISRQQSQGIKPQACIPFWIWGSMWLYNLPAHAVSPDNCDSE